MDADFYRLHSYKPTGGHLYAWQRLGLAKHTTVQGFVLPQTLATDGSHWFKAVCPPKVCHLPLDYLAPTFYIMLRPGPDTGPVALP